MEDLGKNGGLLVRVALNRTNIGVAIDVPEKWVFSDFTEVLRYSLEVLWRKGLIGQGDDLVLEPQLSEFGDLRVGEVLGERSMPSMRAPQACPEGVTVNVIPCSPLIILLFVVRLRRVVPPC